MPKTKLTSSQEQYRAYEHDLPTAKTISDFKLNMAVQNKKDAVLALKNMKAEDKCTLHFDSTQRLALPNLLQQAVIFIDTSHFCL